jgi:hypothetical protein
MLDGLGKLNQKSFESVGDPEIQTRIQQYEMAYRMQTSVPELADLSGEAEHTYALYGEESKTRGSFANSALMARRLLERGVRFVQIFHRGWDQHSNLPRDIASQCNDVDQGCYGLIQDLKQRGMLEDTLVIWGGEFGRTVYSQGTLTDTDYGRDHHPRCFSICMAGGGVKGGQVYGETDEMSYNITQNPVHIRDLHATILHALGIDHERLTHKFQGLDNRLTGVVPAKVIKEHHPGPEFESKRKRLAFSSVQARCLQQRVNIGDMMNFNKIRKPQASESGVGICEADEFILHRMRCVYLSKKRWQKVLQSEQAEVQNHRGVGDDNHAIRAERIETRSCSTISGVKEGIRRRNNSSSNAKRSKPAMLVATDLETRPLENKATASSSFSSDSLKEANAGSSVRLRITGGR